MLSSFDDDGVRLLVADLGPQREFERTSGLPWHRTVSELEAEYGVESWRGFQDVVPLSGMRALGFDEGVQFRHRLFEPRRNYPAYEFQAELTSANEFQVELTSANEFQVELNPCSEHLANHRWSVDHLTRRFGRPPRKADELSNCLRDSWDFGLFEVSLLTYLPEKNRCWANALYERHPDLWQVTNLTVECRLCACREPLALDLSDSFSVDRAGGVRIGSGDFLTNRLLVAHVPTELCLWRDRRGQRMGVANGVGAIVRPWNPLSRLVLCERTPARGGGSASLEWDGVTLLQCADWKGLRDVARQCAAFLDTSVETHSELDE